MQRLALGSTTRNLCWDSAGSIHDSCEAGRGMGHDLRPAEDAAMQQEAGGRHLTRRLHDERNSAGMKH